MGTPSLGEPNPHIQLHASDSALENIWYCRIMVRDHMAIFMPSYYTTLSVAIHGLFMRQTQEC